MRTAAWEAAPQLWETAPKRQWGKVIWFWWKGRSIPWSTHFTKGFLLGSDVTVKGFSASLDMRRCKDQFSSVAQSCWTPWDPMDHSTPGLPVYHQLPEFTQTHVHWVSDAIQPSHPLSSPSPPAFNLSQHQGLFKWVNSSHQVAKRLEFQLQHQSFQWTFRTDLL